ncbi:MarR family winged helix-turn-helix transcriptional regulator [Streptomyces cinereospinus]|uniref:MarR family winged helix-turn-helix transcriptional regulator n=1 Tax=Streptomyces cinereospinus TaxID=285561 RepID=A0ABV5N8B8_9ACTN
MDELQLAEQMLSCVTKMRRALDERLKVYGLSVPRKRVLGALTEGPVRQGTLAAAFAVTPRTITELVDGLQRDGLVERRDDPADRRARLVCLTPAGRLADEQAKAARAEVIGGMFADLPAEDRAALARILTSIDHRLGAVPLDERTR